MRVRSSSGSRRVVRLGALVVIGVLVVFGGSSAFGQQKQRGQTQQSTAKKSGSSPMLPIKKETEMRTQSIPEVVITEERDPNPTRPVHQPPTLITPPSTDPLGGGAGPPGGGTSLPSPDCSNIIVHKNQCRCPDKSIPEIRTSVYMTKFRDPALGDTTCPTPIIYRSSILSVVYEAQRDFGQCDHQWTPDQICQGGQFNTWLATYGWNVDLGCDYMPYNKLAIEKGIGAPAGSFKFEKHDGAPYIPIYSCRGNNAQ